MTKPLSAPPNAEIKMALLVPESELLYAVEYEYAREAYRDSEIIANFRQPIHSEAAKMLDLATLSVQVGPWALFSEFPGAPWLGIPPQRRQAQVRVIEDALDEIHSLPDFVPTIRVPAARIVPMPREAKFNHSTLPEGLERFVLEVDWSQPRQAILNDVCRRLERLEKAAKHVPKDPIRNNYRAALKRLGVLRLVRHFQQAHNGAFGSQAWAIDEAFQYAQADVDDLKQRGTSGKSLLGYSRNRYVRELSLARRRIKEFRGVLEERITNLVEAGDLEITGTFPAGTPPEVVRQTVEGIARALSTALEGR